MMHVASDMVKDHSDSKSKPAAATTWTSLSDMTISKTG